MTDSPIQKLLIKFVEDLETSVQTLGDDRVGLRIRMTETNKLFPQINFICSRIKNQSFENVEWLARQKASVTGALEAIGHFRNECSFALNMHELEKEELKRELRTRGLHKGSVKRAILEMDETRPPIKARELRRLKLSLSHYQKLAQPLNDCVPA